MSASFCLAIAFDQSGGDTLIWNGSTWSTLPTELPSDNTELAGPVSVACTSTSFCAAIDNGGRELATFNGVTWGGIDSGDDQIVLSCASASFCVSFDPNGNVWEFNGAQWSKVENVDPTGNEITTVACAPTVPATLCVAVDGAGNAMVFNGTTWSRPAFISPDLVDARASCPTSTFCLVAGRDSVAGGEVFAFNGSTWSAPEAIDTVGPGINYLSCATTTFCAEIDEVGAAAIYSAPMPTTPPGILAPSGESLASPLVGWTLTETHGTYSTLPSSYSYQWEDCDAGGANCVDIPGATAQSYSLASSDVGDTIRVEEEAVGPAGSSGWQTSTATGPVMQATGHMLAVPALSGLHESRSRWATGNALATLAQTQRPKTPVGTVFTFSLNENAQVSFTFTERSPGRRGKGGKCVAPTKRNRRQARCTRTANRGTLTLAGHAGSDRVAFDGRISRVRKLSTGSYHVDVLATNSSGQRSSSHRLSFTIVS